MKIFLSDDRPVHLAFEQAFKDQIEVVRTQDALCDRLASKSGGLVVLDAHYEDASGYAICERVKALKNGEWRVHILSNESSLGVQEKAAYAGVDRVFILPLELAEVLDCE